MKKPLSKLSKVDLRDVWGHEALDFTNWLAQKENLDVLSQEIGIEIKLIKTEANVGRFNVDILAEEESANRKIIIENQLEDTNHDHLGKIITYAAGYDAEIIIWIHYCPNVSRIKSTGCHALTLNPDSLNPQVLVEWASSRTK